jgi:hypothetical protein
VILLGGFDRYEIVACDCSQVTSPKYTCVWAVRDVASSETKTAQ